MASGYPHRPRELRVILPPGRFFRHFVRRRLHLAGDVGDAGDNSVFTARGVAPGVVEQFPGVLGVVRVHGRLLPGAAVDADFNAAQRRAVVQHEAEDVVVVAGFGDADDGGLQLYSCD